MVTFNAKIINGKMDFGSDYNEQRFQVFLNNNNGKELRLEIIESKRSKSQNSFYWLYLKAIERETGQDSKECHEYFRRSLLPPVYKTIFGKEIRLPNSTTHLTKLEFGEYLEKICAETGVPIPDAESFKDERDSAPTINN